MTEGKSSEDLIKRCSDQMRLIAGLAKGQDAEWLALDMGMGQFKAMLVLKEQGQQTVGGLARVLKISEPSASLLLEKLVTRDLVLRNTDPVDRRRTLVALSDTGDELMVRLRRSSEAQLTAWLGSVAEGDLQALSQGLEALLVSIQSGVSAGMPAQPGQREGA